MNETHPYGDYIPTQTKYLILGSFPSKAQSKDNEVNWFYSSGKSQFWPILRQVYKLPLATINQKMGFLSELEMGIADIIFQCERRDSNSLDMNLTNIIYNPRLENLLHTSQIETIFFTSRFVEKQYRKSFKHLIIDLPNIKLLTLPSPSPRYAQLTLQQKVERYKILLPKLK